MGLFENRSAASEGNVRRCEPNISASVEPFWQRLAETIEWVRKRIDVTDPQQCLRSRETRPRTLERDCFAAVWMVATCRRNRVTAEPGERSLGGGRLLVYYPEDELADGAAEAESEGFFDVHNAPPWDTWVAMVEDVGRSERNPYLIAWIPREFVAHAQRGIDVNPEECIRWFDDCDLAIKSLVRGSAGQ